MKSKSGFSLVEGLLIILILSVVGFGGYLVWDRNQKNTDETGQDNSRQIFAETTEEDQINEDDANDNTGPSKNWERYSSGKNTFSIKIADGLEGARDTTSDFFIFSSFTSNSSPAIVQDVDGYGGDGFFALLIFTDDNANMWNSTERLNLKSEDFITNSGLKGTKTSYDDPYLPPCDGLGCYLGDKQVVYDFTNTDTNKTTRIWYARRVVNEESKLIYNITEDDPDYTEIVDEIVKTLIVN